MSKSSSSDKDTAGAFHEPVDLGKQLEQPRIPGAKPDGQAAHDLAEGISPQSRLRGGADPTNIGPGEVKLNMRG